MDRKSFLKEAAKLRAQGKSIRAIASALEASPSRVYRALKTVSRAAHPGSDRAFVGRQKEITALDGALQAALAGRGRLILLSGEPGIGKTRTAEEIGDIALQRGARVVWGRCYEQQGAPSYWPWIQIIRAYIQLIDEDTLLNQIGGAAAEIAEIAPEIRDRIPNFEPAPALEPQRARFRLFDSITTFLKNASESQSLVLILEDLHWADRSSLSLLEFLVRELTESRLLVVGTYRDVGSSSQGPLSHTIGEMVRNPLFQLVHLAGLMPDDVGQYVGQALGRTPPQDLVDAICERTEGNPFFMAEVVRLWERISSDPAQAKAEDEWTSAIPDKVSAAIGRRLSYLPEGCNRALTIASVIGSEFGIDQLERAIGGPSGKRHFEVLEEPLAARIIEEVPHVVGRYRFAHVLIRETLLQELSSVRRTRLHAEVGEVLEELYAADAEDHAPELAYHFAEAQALVGTQKLVKYSFIAGEAALAAYAWEEAQAHFERALVAKHGQAMNAETATMLFGLGQAQVATIARSQAQQAVDTLRRAFNAFVDLGDTKNAVAAATHPHGFLSFSLGTAEMTARALDLVPRDSLEAGYLLSRYGPALSWENKDYERAQENLDRAAEIARREGDQVLEVRALL